MRTAELARTTKETDISLQLNLDGSSKTAIQTGMGFADHMLTLLAHWAGFDLAITCKGDVEVDWHHSLEDIGICLGQAMLEALGDKTGIGRVGWARVPMDEALCDVSLDLSGRPYFLLRNQELLPPVIAGEESDLWREFFKSLAFSSRMNLHLDLAYGRNGHHLLESACKGLGLALRQAVSRTRDDSTVLSTKGSLDA